MPSTTDLSDYVLVQAAIENRAEFRELYWRYAAKIYQYVRYRINSKENTEDIVSDIFMKALSKLHTYNDRQPFSAWLYTIARHTVIDFWRTQKVTIDLDAIAEIVQKSDHLETKIDTALQIETIMKQLSEVDRNLITLRFIDDLPYKDIAKITGKSESALRTTFSRLKSTLNAKTL